MQANITPLNFSGKSKLEILTSFGYAIVAAGEKFKATITEDPEAFTVVVDTEAEAISAAYEFLMNEVDPDIGYIFPDFEVENPGITLQAEEASAQPVNSVSIRLVMDVKYLPNGVSITELTARLQAMCEKTVGEGMLTGASDAEVEKWSAKSFEVPVAPSEDEVANFMRQRMESGDLDAEDIPLRMARYGLMDAHDFAAEMAERMNLAQDAS